MNLSALKLEDQYSKSPEWEQFKDLPLVLVLGGEKASESAYKWGTWLHTHNNSDFIPGKDHLRALDPREKIKVVAVATLPSVPGFFKGLFRSGFRSKTKMGVVLDFEAQLSSHFNYSTEMAEPALVIFSPQASDIKEAKVFRGHWDNESMREQIIAQLNTFKH